MKRYLWLLAVGLLASALGLVAVRHVRSVVPAVAPAAPVATSSLALALRDERLEPEAVSIPRDHDVVLERTAGGAENGGWEFFSIDFQRLSQICSAVLRMACTRGATRPGRIMDAEDTPIRTGPSRPNRPGRRGPTETDSFRQVDDAKLTSPTTNRHRAGDFCKGD